GRELEGIGQEVQEYLLDLALVGADRSHAGVDRTSERDAPPRCPLAHEGERVVNRARQVEVRDLQLHPPRLDLREVEGVVDEGELVFGSDRDLLQIWHQPPTVQVPRLLLQ